MVPQVKSRLTDPTGKQVALLKSFLERFHTDAFLIHDILRRSSREESRKLVIKVYEFLSDTLPLRFVGFEDRSASKTLDDGCDFPS